MQPDQIVQNILLDVIIYIQCPDISVPCLYEKVLKQLPRVQKWLSFQPQLLVMFLLYPLNQVDTISSVGRVLHIRDADFFFASFISLSRNFSFA